MPDRARLNRYILSNCTYILNPRHLFVAPDNRLVVFGGISLNQNQTFDEINVELVAILNCTNWSWAVFLEKTGVDTTLTAPNGYALFDHSLVS